MTKRIEVDGHTELYGLFAHPAKHSLSPLMHNHSFEKNGIKYLACTVIKDSSGYPMGVFGITWETIPPNIDSLKDKIHNYLIDDRGDIKPLIQVNSITKKYA